MEAVGIPVAEERGRPVFQRFSLEGDALFERLARVTPPGFYCADVHSTGMPRALPCPGHRDCGDLREAPCEAFPSAHRAVGDGEHVER